MYIFFGCLTLELYMNQPDFEIKSNFKLEFSVLLIKPSKLSKLDQINFLLIWAVGKYCCFLCGLDGCGLISLNLNGGGDDSVGSDDRCVVDDVLGSVGGDVLLDGHRGHVVDGVVHGVHVLQGGHGVHGVHGLHAVADDG